MTNQITAIPTVYRGYTFRSRLEARWQVAFDELGIEVWYEPEGFRLPTGDLYLPDFYIPQVHTWAEVKPDVLTPAEMRKAGALVRYAPDLRPCVLLIGPPAFRLYPMLVPFELDGGREIDLTDCLLDVDYHTRKYFREGRLFASIEGGFASETDFTTEYRQAVYAARAATFAREAA